MDRTKVIGAVGALGVILLLALFLSRAGRVTASGRVTSHAGQPLVGLSVRAIPQPFSVPWSDNLIDPRDPREHSVVADHDGCYRLKRLSARPYRATAFGGDSPLGRLLATLLRRRIPSFPQQYELVVDAKGFAIQKILIAIDQGDLQGLDFVLEPGVVIAGRVRDTTGRPLAGRSLWLVPEGQASAQPGQRKNVVPDIPATDTNGGFRLERVPLGTYRLKLAVYPDRGWEVSQSACSGLLRIAADEPNLPRDFRFEAPEDRGRIAARVVEAGSGAPVGSFSFRVLGVDSSGGGSPIPGYVTVNREHLPLTPTREATGREGAFRIDDISPGTATLEITAEGYAREKPRILVNRGQTTEITLALQREGILQGLTTRNGKPCGHGYVNLRRVGEPPEAGVDAYTDAQGCYEYRGLPTGEYLLRTTVWLREDSPFSAQVTEVIRAPVEAGRTSRHDFEFARGATLQGQFHASNRKLRWFVLVEDASPEAAALAPQDRVRGSAWKIERSGRYSIEGLAPGRYTVTAKCLRHDEPGAPVAQRSETISLKDGETATLDFKF